MRARFPVHAVLGSFFFHVMLLHVHIPAWVESRTRPQLTLPRIELVYYGPARDLPPLRLLAPPKKASPPAEAKKPLPRRGADAFHPRQTILSAPVRPTHPRQTLIQPDAPPTPPKILPQLPNIVQWNQSKQPAKPRFRLSAPSLAKARRRTEPSVPPTDLPVPAVPNLERALGELNIASSSVQNVRPRLPVPPMSVPKPGPRLEAGDTGPTPEIGPSAGGDGNLHRLIALSATPAPPAPVVELPPGNLAARIAMSPEGTQTGVPSGSANGTVESGGSPGGSTGGTGGTGSSAVGVSISGGGAEPAGSVSGPVARPASPSPARPLPNRPLPRIALVNPTRVTPAIMLEAPKPGTPADSYFGPRRVYTLYVNMPNLASASGSWILRFAELTTHGEKNAADDGAPELAGPMPLHKVDPKYPPALVSAGVQGDVTLYAIIRRDGSVDSIQVVRSLDLLLDQNAMEALARWKFRPAERGGSPVELEALVQIPFRITRPF